MMTLQRNNIYYGWIVNDVVTFTTTWCVLCAKSRYHEVYDSRSFCMGCGNQEIITVSDVREENI